MRKGLGLGTGGLPLWWLLLPLNGPGRETVPEVVTGEWEGRQKGAEEVERGSGKCGSRFFS